MCDHSGALTRFTTGTRCDECNIYFSKDSEVYRRIWMLSSIWMVLNNINVGRRRSGQGTDLDVQDMMNEIGIGKNHDNNYNDLIIKAEPLMAKYKENADSASLTVG